MKWEEVLKTHRSWRGVAVRGGKVVSLLCNQHKDGDYGDAIFEDRIGYVMPNDALLADRKALEAMIGADSPIHVFEKLGVNSWRDHGEWVVIKLIAGDQVSVFELRRPVGGKATP